MAAAGERPITMPFSGECGYVGGGVGFYLFQYIVSGWDNGCNWAAGPVPASGRTLEDFALPPDMMAAAGEQPITMPFSGVCLAWV
jgi:hypothetical protein